MSPCASLRRLASDQQHPKPLPPSPQQADGWPKTAGCSSPKTWCAGCWQWQGGASSFMASIPNMISTRREHVFIWAHQGRPSISSTAPPGRSAIHGCKTSMTWRGWPMPCPIFTCSSAPLSRVILPILTRWISTLPMPASRARPSRQEHPSARLPQWKQWLRY